MRFLVVLAVIAITVYSVIDCVRAEERQRRGLPAWLWVTVIIVLPGVGGLVWLLVSRSTPQSRPRGYTRPNRPIAPDDDPEFLSGLARSAPRETPVAPAPDVPETPEQEPADAEEAGSDQDEDGEGGDQPSRDDRGRRSPE